MRAVILAAAAAVVVVGGCGAGSSPSQKSSPPTPSSATSEGATATGATSTSGAGETSSASSSTAGYGQLITTVSVIEVAGGASYEITPADALRSRVSPEIVDAAWEQVTAQLPEPPTPGLRDQFVCHVYFAARKPVWHIEPWRPDVGYPATIAAACNPGPIADPDRS
ncbi:MAG: DUF2599 domain-containing protein [Actinobacteria bacterium]|nr:DUF2599 domain-containing protein [Actinomycetota bacterium]